MCNLYTDYFLTELFSCEILEVCDQETECALPVITTLTMQLFVSLGIRCTIHIVGIQKPKSARIGMSKKVKW